MKTANPEQIPEATHLVIDSVASRPDIRRAALNAVGRFINACRRGDVQAARRSVVAPSDGSFIGRPDFEEYARQVQVQLPREISVHWSRELTEDCTPKLVAIRTVRYIQSHAVEYGKLEVLVALETVHGQMTETFTVYALNRVFKVGFNTDKDEVGQHSNTSG